MNASCLVYCVESAVNHKISMYVIPVEPSLLLKYTPDLSYPRLSSLHLLHSFLLNSLPPIRQVITLEPSQ
jgi:hypothetical protein